MKKLFFLSILCLLSSQLFAQKADTVKIQGKIKEEKTGEDVYGAYIKFLRNGELYYFASTDFEGNFELNILEGKYDIEVSYIGYKTMKISSLVFSKTSKLTLDLVLKKENIITDCNILMDYKIPLYSAYNMSSGAIYSNEAISNLPR